ncbi:MAG TPA: hypothetical protein VKY89_22860 [Thermoanaerobaculia bacterium]|jgi:hypothetical protein|nr:hypothetical protein [Thermoanaerobaculia bacterium]
MSDEPKYRQRGYQDSGERRSSTGPRGPQAPRPKPEGPRGRGLGAPTENVFRCAACGAKRLVSAEAGHPDFLALDATCARCGADLHTCSNCVHFDTGSRWECRRHAELPARIAKKGAGNQCELFAPRLAQEFGADREHPAGPSGPSAARAAFDALFKT